MDNLHFKANGIDFDPQGNSVSHKENQYTSASRAKVWHQQNN